MSSVVVLLPLTALLCAKKNPVPLSVLFQGVPSVDVLFADLLETPVMHISNWRVAR